MKIPFERNHYFWGKLLSADDFEAEQRYLNEKRNFINRLLWGGGILCGLEAVKLDEKQILIQSGAALDFNGREIVLPKPVSKSISLIDGFSYHNQDGYAYLCISVHDRFQDMAATIEGGDKKQFNRIVEDARLYLTSVLPSYPTDVQSLEEALENSGHIAIAKVYFTTGEGTFVLERVEDLRRLIVKQQQEEIMPDYTSIFTSLETKIEKIIAAYRQLSQMRPTISSGVATIDFALQAKRNRVFYSAPIVHGLGPGLVSATLGVLSADTATVGTGKESVFFDAHGIFEESYAAVSAKVQVMEGTLVIGARITTDVPLTQIKVHWTVLRDNAFMPLPSVKQDAFLSIKPSVAHVARRERFRFQAESWGLNKADIIWKLKDADSGAIQKNGEYFAPPVPGVYEVLAVAGKHSASAFVVVK